MEQIADALQSQLHLPSASDLQVEEYSDEVFDLLDNGAVSLQNLSGSSKQ